jgi:hypothetical protein
MFWLGGRINGWLEQVSHSFLAALRGDKLLTSVSSPPLCPRPRQDVPSVAFLTFIFVALIFDGWALTLLSHRNLSYASTAQTIGLNLGYFLSFTVFLAFNSVEFGCASCTVASVGPPRGVRCRRLTLATSRPTPNLQQQVLPRCPARHAAHHARRLPPQLVLRLLPRHSLAAPPAEGGALPSFLRRTLRLDSPFPPPARACLRRIPSLRTSPRWTSKRSTR